MVGVDELPEAIGLHEAIARGCKEALDGLILRRTNLEGSTVGRITMSEWAIPQWTDRMQPESESWGLRQQKVQTLQEGLLRMYQMLIELIYAPDIVNDGLEGLLAQRTLSFHLQRDKRKLFRFFSWGNSVI